MTVRYPLALAGVACLALAACGPKKTETAPTTTVTEVAAAPTAVATFPAVPANARTAVKYDGTYTRTGADGKTATLALGPGDAYSMTDSAGKTTKGTFNWYSDNSRILIKQDGKTSVFAIADGAIYQLAGKDTPTTGPFTEDMTWRRAGM